MTALLLFAGNDYIYPLATGAVSEEFGTISTLHVLDVCHFDILLTVKRDPRFHRRSLYHVDRPAKVAHLDVEFGCEFGAAVYKFITIPRDVGALDGGDSGADGKNGHVKAILLSGICSEAEFPMAEKLDQPTLTKCGELQVQVEDIASLTAEARLAASLEVLRDASPDAGSSGADDTGPSGSGGLPKAGPWTTERRLLLVQFLSKIKVCVPAHLFCVGKSFAQASRCSHMRLPRPWTHIFGSIFDGQPFPATNAWPWMRSVCVSCILRGALCHTCCACAKSMTCGMIVSFALRPAHGFCLNGASLPLASRPLGSARYC